MKNIKTEITINNTPDKVWSVLTDFKNHPNWNPFINNISGEKKVGQKLIVSIKSPEGNGMTFKPKVLKFEEEKEFRWRGKLLIRGIFDGEHYFILKAKGNSQTTFIHGEKFSGILVYLSGKMLEKTKGGFNEMNKSLKKECEKTINN